MLEEIKMSQLSIAEKNEIKSFINKTFSYPKLPPKKELKVLLAEMENGFSLIVVGVYCNLQTYCVHLVAH